MSGYSFWCTPCGFAHAGECEPKPHIGEPDQPWECTITVGSRWIFESEMPAGGWLNVGPADGYEVMSILTNGVINESAAIQVREWGQKLSPVLTLPLLFWQEGGYDNGIGFKRRMVAWT